jgi:hypothetical protein
LCPSIPYTGIDPFPAPLQVRYSFSVQPLVPVFRLCLLVLLTLSSSWSIAQRESSLTQDFAKLSAKERARIAAREEQDAAADTAFQARMKQAELRFQQGAFQDALDLYRQARTMRPYNVHPKVKIQDLEALVARQQAAEPLPAPVTVIEPPEPTGRPSPTVEPTLAEPPVVAPSLPRTDPALAPHAPPKEVIERPTVPVAKKAGVRSFPVVDGTQERTFKEGRAVVLEREVVQDGRASIWRMVTHPWGDVVYFKDGDPVPVRTWKEQFGE